VFCGERGGNVQTTHCRGFRTCHGGAGEQLEVEIRDRRRPATSDLLKKARRGSYVMMQCQLFPISVAFLVCVGKPLSSVCSAQHAVNTSVAASRFFQVYKLQHPPRVNLSSALAGGWEATFSPATPAVPIRA